MHSEYFSYHHSPFELEQLKLLNTIYNANSQHTLEKLLMPGMNVLEIGCGSAILGRWIAQKIGEEGTYVGVERDGQQIRMAEQHTLDNMVFIESEVERINEIALLRDAEGNECDVPSINSQSLEQCEPIYQTLPGWKERTAGITDYEALPFNARQYLAYLENLLGVPIVLVSTGPDRSESIVLHPPFVDAAG